MKFTKSETVGQGLAPAVKKLLSLMLAIVMLFSITVSIDISAYALTSGDYECSVKNGTATITKYNGLESDITIPSDIDGYSVTAIGNYAFKGCWSLENVTIPDSVISIGSGAFSNCSCLISIDIPNSVTSIGNSAFFYCESLNSVTLPKNIKVIKYMMFENCINLEKVIIPDGVTSIEFDAFDRCTSLTHITIPNSITEIGHSAFYQCENLDGSYKLMKTTTATSFTTAFATYNKQFSYKMRAVKGNTKSAYSSVVNAKNTKKLQTPTMKATVNANGTFKLSWNKVTGADKYELYIKQANGSYKLMKTTTATSFTTAYATYNKQFSYKMRAINSKNKSIASAYSAVVSTKNTKKLQAPTMKATVNKNGTFKLSWNKVDGATSYKLYIKQANGSYKLMKTTSATSFTTAVATKGKTYSYKMVAVTSKNKNATSAYSNVVSAKRK